MPQSQTSTITIQYTGVAISPDNFQINIIDYLDASRIYNNTNVTRVSRGTLLSGYNVTGITGGDVTIRATADGACSTSADVDITQQALQFWEPNTPTEIYPGPTTGEAYSFGLNSVETAHFATLSGFTFLETTDFTISHVSTTGSGVSGGPFSSFSLTENTPGVFVINGTSNSMGTDNSLNQSVFRITYNGNGNYADFNFYWVVNL
jgi:hypothetical protein